MKDAMEQRACNLALFLIRQRATVRAAAKQFGIAYDKWIKAIENTVAPKFVEMNKKAFDLGYNS